MSKVPRSILGMIPVGMFYAGSVCKARKYPWAPMLTTLLFMAVGLGIVRKTICVKVKRHKFYGAVAGISFYVAFMIGVVWAYYVWAEPSHKWSRETKTYLAEQVPDVYANVYKNRSLIYAEDCGPDKNTTMLDELPTKEKGAIRKACAQAATLWFLCWTAPAIAIGCDLTVSMFCHITAHLGKGVDVTNLQKVLTKFMLLVAFCLTGMWGCATVSSSSLHLGSTLMAFFMTALAILCMWLVSEVDLSKLQEAAEHNALMQQIVGIARSDWSKAFVVGAMGFPFVSFMVLNMATNFVRKKRGLASAAQDDKFTPKAREAIEHLVKWNWTSICLKIIILGELFFTLQVGVSKATYIFLSWLNELLSPVELKTVCGLVFAIGGTMFLLPPVPGLPVYVFAGILLGEKGKQDPSIGFAGAIAIATIIGLFTKMCACVGQYMIGYFLGKSLKVQQLIGVDKVPTRAIERILKTRGLNLGKVAVLVGGPDWPTSVTCGIVHVNIPQMLLGTIPVLTLMIPCILAGACMGRAQPGEESVWNLAANVATLSAAAVNMASMAYAVYTISQTIGNYGEELAKPRPEHQAVAELTRREQSAVDNYNQTIHWSRLNTFWKVFLIVPTLGCYGSNCGMVVFAERCFLPFALSSKIGWDTEEGGLGGHPKNIIIYPYGHGALFMFFVSVFLHYVFLKVMARKARKEFKARGGV